MEEIFDKFSYLQQHTTGSEETLKQTYTEENESEQTTSTKLSTPTKSLKKTISIDEQEEIKSSPQKKVVADTSKQCLSEGSNNISSPQSMDDRRILEVIPTPCANEEIVSKPEGNWNYSFKTALKTEEFCSNTPTSENPIDDTKEDQTLKYDFANTDQTSSKTQTKDLYDVICETHEKLNTTQKSDCLIDMDSTNQNTVFTDKLEIQVNQILSKLFVENSKNSENSFEADDSQDKLDYSKPAQNLPETIQGNINSKSQRESEILNFSSKRLESENDSSALSNGKEIPKATCDSYVPSAHVCKRNTDSNQIKPNFNSKISQKLKKPSLEKEKNICIKESVKRLNSNSDCTESKKKNLNVSKQTSSHSKSHNYDLSLQLIEYFFRNISQGAEKTTDTNKVVSKISQGGIIPAGKYTINKSIETHQITESSELSERISSDSRCNTEMGDNFVNTYSKLNFDMPPTPVASPELPYLSEKSRESDDLTSRESKSSKDSKTKGVYTPSRESTESIMSRENSCRLNTSVKFQNIAEEHHYVSSLTSPESPEPETGYTSVSELDKQEKSDEIIIQGENTIENSRSTKISSKQSELQVKSDEVSRESVSDERSSDSETFSLDMGGLITDVINRIVGISLTFDSQLDHWENTDPVLEINIPENIERPGHDDIMETFNSIHGSLLRIADAANISVENILDRIRALRPHMDVLELVRDTVNTVEHFLKDLREVAEMVCDLEPCTENTPYRYYYREFHRSVVSIHRALNGIIQHLQRIGIFYRNEQAGNKKPKA